MLNDDRDSFMTFATYAHEHVLILLCRMGLIVESDDLGSEATVTFLCHILQRTEMREHNCNSATFCQNALCAILYIGLLARAHYLKVENL